MNMTPSSNSYTHTRPENNRSAVSGIHLENNVTPPGLEEDYLGLGDAVDDGLQGFVRVTLEDALHAAGSGGNGLPHRHVQVVVVFLGR